MRNCRRCGKLLSINSDICEACGFLNSEPHEWPEKFPEYAVPRVRCPNCRTDTLAGKGYCENCGYTPRFKTKKSPEAKVSFGCALGCLGLIMLASGGCGLVMLAGGTSDALPFFLICAVIAAAAGFAIHALVKNYRE